jgi:hypothetical protein
MEEQQEHLKSLLEQRASLEMQINQNRDLLLKVQGAIEYLNQVGVTLPEPVVSESEEQLESLDQEVE